MKSVSEDEVAHTFMVRNRLRTMRETHSQSETHSHTETHSQPQIHTLHKYCALTISLEKTMLMVAFMTSFEGHLTQKLISLLSRVRHMKLVNTLGFSKHFTFSWPLAKVLNS